MEKFRLTDKQALEIDNLLRKIALKKYHQYRTLDARLDIEDIVQELWINALEICNRKQSVEIDLIADASYRKIVDIIRREIRRPYILIDESSLDYDREDDCSRRGFKSKEPLHSKIGGATELSEIHEILNLFEEGSRERKMVELFLEMFTSLEEFDNKDSFKDEDKSSWNYETWIAHQLGLAGSYSSAYNKCKNRVQAVLVRNGYGKGFSDAIERLQRLGYDIKPLF